MTRAGIIAASAALFLLAGCSAVGGLFGSGAARDGAETLASNSGSIIDAVDYLTEPSDSFCRKEAGGAAGAGALVPVYKVTKGDCGEGDTELKEYEYNAIVAENEAKTWQKLHTAAMAEAAKPTYCRTAVVGIVYRSSSDNCQRGEATISEEEYDAAKREQAAAATKLP